MSGDDLNNLVDTINKRQQDKQRGNGILARAKRKFLNYVAYPALAALTAIGGVNAYLYNENPDNYLEFAKYKGGEWLKKHAPSLYEEETYIYPDISIEDATLNDMAVPRYVEKRMVFAVSSTEVEYDMLRLMAAQESSFKATVKNEFSKACGLLQLVPSTQLELMYHYGEDYGYERLSKHIKNNKGVKDIADPKLRETVLNICTDAFFSLEMGAEYARENIAKLHEDFSGRYVSYTDVYMYHFFGANGGRKFLENLEQTPERAVYKDYPERVVHANKPTFYKDAGKGEARSYAEIYEYYASKLSTQIIAKDKQRHEEHYTWGGFLGRTFPSI
jgi:hypothetical protein